jgi:hypothetical protein
MTWGTSVCVHLFGRMIRSHVCVLPNGSIMCLVACVCVCVCVDVCVRACVRPAWWRYPAPGRTLSCGSIWRLVASCLVATPCAVVVLAPWQLLVVHLWVHVSGCAWWHPAW